MYKMDSRNKVKFIRSLRDKNGTEISLILDSFPEAKDYMLHVLSPDRSAFPHKRLDVLKFVLENNFVDFDSLGACACGLSMEYMMKYIRK